VTESDWGQRIETTEARPPTTGRTAAVVATGLTKRYGERLAVDHIDFELPRGVVSGFVGPNGAGKTTTIRMLLGLIRPTHGTAHVLGQPISHPPHTCRGSAR
jgi:ABC-2 type transport system ATP-binding protein